MGCGGEVSLKLLIGNVLECKAINLIFKCGFTLKNNNVKMTPLYSRDLFFVHENPEMFSICCVTHSNFLLCFLSGIFQESVLSREHWLDTAALLQSGVLLLLISSFHFRDKR